MSWKTEMLPRIKVPCLVPCGADKAPIEKAWQQKGYSADEVLNMGDKVRAVGINTAKANLVCIDLDGVEAFDLVERYKLPLPPTWVIGRSNDENRMKRVYRVTPEQRERLPIDAGKWKKGTLEVFWRSQQFIVAGEHPSGGYYTWDHDSGPESISNLPDEWITFLPKRKEPPALSDIREIDLQGLLTREHAGLVDTGLGSEGGRNTALFALAADAYAAEAEARRRASHDIRVTSTADDLIAEALRRTDLTGMTQSEIDQTLRSAREGRVVTHGFEDRWAYCIGSSRKPRPAPAGAVQIDASCKWTALAELLPSGWSGKNSDRKYKLDCGSACSLFEASYGDRLRYNLLGYEFELDGAQLSNAERFRFLAGVQNQGYSLTDEVLYQGLLAAAQPRSYHPVVEYLEGLGDGEIMDSTKLATLLLGVDDDLSNHMLQRFLIGAVRRALEPGCKMDYCCILQGEQGDGKSEFWRALFSPFYQTFDSKDQGKDRLLRLHKAWGIELAEFDSMTNRQASGELKNFITTAVDTVRRPYSRKAEDLPRPSVFAGTCNTDDFLKDSTGERRYWVIPVRGVRIDFERVAALRDTVWRSVMADVRAGMKPYLPREIELLSYERNDDFKDAPVLHQLMLDITRGKDFLRIDEVLRIVLDVGFVVPGKATKEIKQAMEHIGWCQHRLRNYPRYWRRKSVEVTDRNRSAVITMLERPSGFQGCTAVRSHY